MGTEPPEGISNPPEVIRAHKQRRKADEADIMLA